MYTLGIDFGSSSIRTVVVRVSDGLELSLGEVAYRSGVSGLLLDPCDAHVVRQAVMDYLYGLEHSVLEALQKAEQFEGFSRGKVVGIGVDATGSTLLALDTHGQPLGLKHLENLSAQVWMWKDHSATLEAERITAHAHAHDPQLLAFLGGTYSSEWYWSKLLRLLETDPQLAQEAQDWAEVADYISALLCGRLERLPRGVCGAGHKALYHPRHGGYPSADFLSRLHPELVRFRDVLEGCQMTCVGESIGTLTLEWQRKFGLGPQVCVSGSGLDAHLGAVGAGIEAGTLVKVIGTSSCDLVVHPGHLELPDIPGVGGIVPSSILPGFHGLESGQSAVGDLFAWWAGTVLRSSDHAALTVEAASLEAGESGLLALDWNNGNRTVLMNYALSGLIVGQTLQTRPAEIYRALIEAAAFGARKIVERLLEHGVCIERLVACGGVAEKNTLLMQIYADVLGMPIRLASSSQTCALGGSIAAAVAAGCYPDVPTAQRAMVTPGQLSYTPNLRQHAVYNRLYTMFSQLHDAFGGVSVQDLSALMRDLIALSLETRKSKVEVLEGVFA